MSLSSSTLNTSGFSRTDGELNGSWDMDAYEVYFEENTTYIISAQNIDLGENLMISLLDENYNLLEYNLDSYGSEDPSIRFDSTISQKVRIIIEAQEDEDNNYVVPYSIGINDIDSFEQSAVTEVELPSNSGFEAKAFSYLNSLDDFSIANLDELVGFATDDDNLVSLEELQVFAYISQNIDKILLEKGIDQNKIDYYSYVFSAAVGSNPANAYWTGGVQDNPQKLGNISVGSNSDHLNKIRRKWFRGEDLPLARIDGDVAKGETPRFLSYEKANGPLFSGEISYNQIAQGGAGTCFLLASLASVAKTDSSQIESMFIDNDDGTYGVRFYGWGAEAWVTVNKELPTETTFNNDSLTLAGSFRDSLGIKDPSTNSLWAGLAEKAYAQINATGILRRPLSENSYQSIEGGNAVALDNITGMKSKELNDIVDVLAAANNSQEIFIGSDVIYRDGIVFNSKEAASEYGNLQFVDNHVYSLIDIDKSSEEFTIYNPWGELGLGHDPQFNISYSNLSNLMSNGLDLHTI